MNSQSVLVNPVLFAAAIDQNYIPAEHLRLLSRYLVDITTWKIKRLAVFMPPRHGKSELISKYFPAWYLGYHPDHRIILTSYEADFAANWGRKARDILEEYGQEFFNIKVSSDSSAANRWDLEGHKGGMSTAGVGGPITGKGANLFIIDDPVKNAEEAYSEVKREKAWEWYRSTAYTRLEPNGAIILIMTRWHMDDLGGRILHDLDADDWTILNLPAVAEENDQLGRNIGEPLWPVRYPIKDFDKIRSTVGEYWWYAMYQQSPYIKTGGMFERSWFEILQLAPHERQVRFWDLAATEQTGSNDPDWTVGALVSERNGQYFIKDIIRVRKGPGDVEELIKQTAIMDGHETRIYMEQEGGSSGKNTIDYYSRHVLNGYSFIGIPSTGSKIIRAQPLSSAAFNRNVKVLDKPWLEDMFYEFETFPNGKHDDIVDAVAGAFTQLALGSISTLGVMDVDSSIEMELPIEDYDYVFCECGEEYGTVIGRVPMKNGICDSCGKRMQVFPKDLIEVNA